MMLFQVSYERLMEEIRNEKIDPNSKDKLEREDLGEAFAYYLTSFDRPKVYVYVVLKSELTDIQANQLFPLSKDVDRRITDNFKLKAIADTLNRIEGQLARKPLVEKHFETKIIEKEIIVESKKELKK